MSTANDLALQAKEEFLDRNRNLLALTKNGANDVFKRISASLALDQKSQDDVLFYLDVIDQKDMAARSVARQDFQKEMYTQICRAFLRVFRNQRIEFVTKSFTPEASEEFTNIEIAAGERAPAPLPVQVPQKSAQELLTEEIKHDWLHLRMDKIKKKFHNPAYKKRFDELVDTLPSQCTSLTDGAKEFRS